MKLSIGENIRKYRKQADLTQEELADKLGVSYQSVSRWENGSTYPDIELLPAIAELLSGSVDELMGIPDAQKEKQASEAIDELQSECMREDYDAGRIASIIRDIRRNYMNSDQSYRLWYYNNERAFSDPRILPEVRLMAEAYLERHPMDAFVIQTMASIEDEEHLGAFIEKHAANYDCSARELLFNRYLRLNDSENFEPERRYKFYNAVAALLYHCTLTGLDASADKWSADDRFMESLLALICDRADGGRPDIWAMFRLTLGFRRAGCLAAEGKTEDSLAALSECTGLLEAILHITDEVTLPTSCSWLDGMEWRAYEDWASPDYAPDSPEERFVRILTTVGNKVGKTNICDCICPGRYIKNFSDACYDHMREKPEFAALEGRVRALVITRPKQG